jgi:hypothetical protein
MTHRIRRPAIAGSGRERRGRHFKTGSEPVDLPALASARVDDLADTYAFATCGSYLGEPTLVDEVISSDALLSFVANYQEFLPVRVRTLV